MIFNTEEEETDQPHLLGPLDEDDPPLMGLVGEITEEASQQLAMSLLSFNGGKILNSALPEDQDEDIEFFISSNGGSVGDMFAVYDLMGVVKNNRDIRTYGFGKIASAAVILLAAGTPGKRFISKNTRLMLHHCSASEQGAVPNLKTIYREAAKVEEMMIHALAENSKLSVGEIYNILSKNTDEYFSAEEVLEMGIVDEII